MATPQRHPTAAEAWDDIGRGTGHRTWRDACRRESLAAAGAYIDAMNALVAAIKAESRWPFAMDKAFVIRRIRRHHKYLAELRLAEATTLVAYGITYAEAFTSKSLGGLFKPDE